MGDLNVLTLIWTLLVLVSHDQTLMSLFYVAFACVPPMLPAHFSLMVSCFAQGRASNDCGWMTHDMNVAQVAQWELRCLG